MFVRTLGYLFSRRMMGFFLMSVVFLGIGLFFMVGSIQKLSAIQQQEQQLQRGVVMCADQQMRPDDGCDVSTEVVDSNGYVVGTQFGSDAVNTYAQQMQANQASLDYQHQSETQLLFVGLGFALLGLGLLTLFILLAARCASRDLEFQYDYEP